VLRNDQTVWRLQFMYINLDTFKIFLIWSKNKLLYTAGFALKCAERSSDSKWMYFKRCDKFILYTYRR
jgi:hypothetical protein